MPSVSILSTEDAGRRDEAEQVRHELYALRPQFCSVTYGAAARRGRHFQTVQRPRGRLRRRAALLVHRGEPGFARARSTRSNGGVRRVVARGDLPRLRWLRRIPLPSDLVAFIRAETGPLPRRGRGLSQMHPQARSPQADLQAYDEVQAGASSAITQMLFNSDAYFRFVDDACARRDDSGRAGDHADHQRDRHHSLRRELRRRHSALGPPAPADYGDDTASIRAFGLDVVTRLCEQLRAGGTPGLHFYDEPEPGDARDRRLGLEAVTHSVVAAIDTARRVRRVQLNRAATSPRLRSASRRDWISRAPSRRNGRKPWP